MMRRLAFVMVPVAGLLGLGLVVAPYLGWASPFRLPPILHFRGRDYIRATCTRTLHANELRKIGSVFGYFTSRKPILLPHYEWHLPPNMKTPAVLYVRGSCLMAYGLSGGP